MRDTEVSFHSAKEFRCVGAITAFSTDDSRRFGPADNVFMTVAVCSLRLALFPHRSHLPLKWNNRIASLCSTTLASYIRYLTKGRDHLVEPILGLSITERWGLKQIGCGNVKWEYDSSVAHSSENVNKPASFTGMRSLLASYASIRFLKMPLLHAVSHKQYLLLDKRY